MVSVRGAGTCAFCGRPGLTLEHVFPQWLVGALPTQEAWRGQDRFRVIWPGQAQPLPRREIPESFTKSRVRCVCRSCNGGWLSDLETKVRQLLSAMIQGKAQTLPATECVTLATWATKTTMMVEFTDLDSHAYRPGDRSWVRERHQPPMGTTVWASPLLLSDEWGLRAEHSGLLIGDQATDISLPCDIQQTTIGLGQLLFVVAHAPPPRTALPPLHMLIPSMRLLWPGPSVVEWPSGPPLAPETAWEVSQLLRRMTSP